MKAVVDRAVLIAAIAGWMTRQHDALPDGSAYRYTLCRCGAVFWHAEDGGHDRPHTPSCPVPVMQAALLACCATCRWWQRGGLQNGFRYAPGGCAHPELEQSRAFGSYVNWEQDFNEPSPDFVCALHEPVPR